jgi:ribosome-associated toxin RatA of RatAB toxin-antitoxin module
MARIEEQIEIAASSSDVFRLCHDIAKRALWDERVGRIELITSAPIRSGTLIQVDARRGGNYFGWEGEYAEFKYPFNSTVKVLDAAASSPFKAGEEEWTFSKMSDGTRLSLVWEYEPRNILYRILDVLGGRAATRAAIRRSLSKLKQLIENE